MEKSSNKLKRNLWITGVSVLITAFIPWLYLLCFYCNNEIAFWLCYAAAYWGYFIAAAFILVFGSITIWKFPIKMIRRAFIFAAWLLLYPTLWMSWLILVVFLISLIKPFY